MNDDTTNGMNISVKALEETQSAHDAAVDDFLSPENQRSNVVGLAVGEKYTDGEPTGDAALIALVDQKLPAEFLSDEDLIPEELPGADGIKTDVVAVGPLFAGGAAPALDLDVAPAADAGIQTLARRQRPVPGGWSVGHFRITAGTIATSVYDILPGGSTNPPRHGTGIPRRYYILSNNHVLANSNAAVLGDRILQPGPFDGGVIPSDTIGFLSRFVPITFAPAVPLNQHNNLVDAAIAAAQFHDIDREVYWIGHIRGWRRRNDVLAMLGQPVQKTGRTTNYTIGRIIGVNATVDVNFGGGNVARFRDQIITTNMSAGGDSGSLLTSMDNVAIGLLFAGSAVATIFNQIEHVRSLLQIEVAEEIL